jgi:type VI secretion system Hcp family effector
MQKSTLYLSLVLAIALSATHTASAQDKMYIRLETGTKGVFQPTQQAARGNSFMPCTSIAFLSAPMSSGSAKSNGVQQHEPLKVTIASAVAAPQLLQTNCSNENLKTVQIEFCHTVKGKELTYMTLKLTNANIKNMALQSDREEVTFNYQKMEYVESPVN